MAKNGRGRPRRYAAYEELVREFPTGEKKRPSYLNGVGVFRGAKGDTAWLKIALPHGGTFHGKHRTPGSSVEIKLGRLDSWSWEELEGQLSQLQQRADKGEPLENLPSVLFSEHARNWLHRNQNRLKSIDVVKVHVEKHLIPAFGQNPLDEIDTQTINRWIEDRSQHVQPATVKRELSTLSSILGDAVRSGLIETNPCKDALTIRGVVGRQRFLDGEELIRLLKNAQDVAEWLPDFILWCVHSGMRKSEVLNLRWQDVQKLSDERHVVSVETGKTNHIRIVHCTKTMNEIIGRQSKISVENNDRVFPVTKMTLRRRWEKARRLAGLEDVTIHDLRRTHGTQAAVAGVDLRTLAGRLGHTDLDMLQRHYAAFVGSAAADAADIIETRLSTILNG